MALSGRFWLMKSEPDELSIDDLAAEPTRVFHWDGVRNFRARNWMADMGDEDRFFFAHSSCKVPGIAGIGRIVGDAHPDPSQFDETSEYFDAKATIDQPRWVCRDVMFVERFPQVLTLAELRAHTDAFGHFHLLQRANRLSVMPVSPAQWELALSLAVRG